MRINIIVALCVIGTFPISVLSQSADRFALEALYHATDGPNWTNSDGWLSGEPLGEWYGITTYEGRVREIDLAGNGLVGRLPNEIAQLSMLNVLDLRWNELSGRIPDVLSNVRSLVRLHLGSNEFTGEIPESLGYLPRLREFDLSYNGLTGTIPEELGHLSSLEGLGLHHNELSGSIPESLGRVESLSRVVVGHNELSGTVPVTLGQLEVLNLTNTSIEDAKGEFDFSTRPPAGLSGTDVLYESVVSLPESDYLREIVEYTMAALHVSDGLVWIDPTTLPEGLPLDQLRAVVERINQHLIDTGERIETVDDLNRMIEVYGSGSVELEEEEVQHEPIGYYGARVPRSTLGPVRPMYFNVPMSSTSAGWTLRGEDESSESATMFLLFGVIDCTSIKVDYAHTSTHGSGALRQRVAKAKTHGPCEYVSGPTQTIRYRLMSQIQRRKDIGIFWIFVSIASRASIKYGYNPSWTQSETMVEASCDPNAGLRWWRGRASMIATGSKMRFFPRPARAHSTPQYLDC